MEKPSKKTVYWNVAALLVWIAASVVNFAVGKPVLGAIWAAGSLLWVATIRLSIKTYRRNCRTYESVQEAAAIRARARRLS